MIVSIFESIAVGAMTAMTRAAGLIATKRKIVGVRVKASRKASWNRRAGNVDTCDDLTMWKDRERRRDAKLSEKIKIQEEREREREGRGGGGGAWKGRGGEGGR